MVEWRRDDYVISTDRTRLSLETICSFLSRSYWADHRTREATERSLSHSLCYGLYYRDKQIGFARLVTDYATFYWLCDVFIDEDQRGKGLGKWLMECIMETPEVKELEFGILVTRDAQGLYAKYGFEEATAVAKAFMYRLREDLERKRKREGAKKEDHT
jgi:GNAT superfamily N-acetyltransferase